MLNPNSCKPVQNSGRSVAYYEVQEGRRVVKVPREQIVHFKRYDPEMGALGVSRLQALSLSYETERDSARFQREFYRKGAQAAGHYSTESAIDDDDIARLKAQFKTHFQGIENSWDPVMLPKALKYTRAGLTFAEMQFIESHKLTSQEILKVYKVPPMLAGILEGARAQLDVARVSMELFLRFGIMPSTTRIAAKLNESLLESGEFGFNISCEFDFSNDPVMVAAFLTQAEMWNKATGAPHISRAEARDHQGLPPREDSEGLDEILVPAGMQSAEMAKAQAEVDLENAKNPPEPPPQALPPDQPPVKPEPEQKARTFDRAMNREVARARAQRRLTAHEAKVATFARRHFLAQTKRLKRS
jgi:HK97 family phage portal protein